MRQAIEALNSLVSQRIIDQYAIGGAIGASFYLQAMQTEDIDAFLFFPSNSSGLITVTPVYEALIALGGKPEGEHLRFGAWPLQVLPDATALVGEAIQTAVTVEYEGATTRVFRPEYLCAVALQTGRRKDFARVRLFLEQHEVDLEALQTLAHRYGLDEGLIRVQHDDQR